MPDIFDDIVIFRKGQYHICVSGKFTCWIFGFHVVVHKPNIVVVRRPNMCWSSGFPDEINANVFVDLFLFSQKAFHSANVFRG